MKYLNYFMLLLFVVSVVVQYNDPDPIQWMAIYACACVGCLAPKKIRKLLPVISAVALAWAAFQAWDCITTPGELNWADVFSFTEMKTIRVELARECGGLLIVATWMMVQWFQG